MTSLSERVLLGSIDPVEALAVLVHRGPGAAATVDDAPCRLADVPLPELTRIAEDSGDGNDNAAVTAARDTLLLAVVPSATEVDLAAAVWSVSIDTPSVGAWHAARAAAVVRVLLSSSVPLATVPAVDPALEKAIADDTRINAELYQTLMRAAYLPVDKRVSQKDVRAFAADGSDRWFLHYYLNPRSLDEDWEFRPRPAWIATVLWLACAVNHPRYDGVAVKHIAAADKAPARAALLGRAGTVLLRTVVAPDAETTAVRAKRLALEVYVVEHRDAFPTRVPDTAHPLVAMELARHCLAGKK